eukprot:GHVU01204062.1.p2 GENE.GHVU01204062.1~~GHVU01204062.1.p2  ORF type:complete len:315 (+),score=65.04 GHVU01204062.1:1373-2317(+)
MATSEQNETVVQSTEDTGVDVDALYNSIMEPDVEPQAPKEGLDDAKDEEVSEEAVKSTEENTDDYFVLKHKDFEEGERKFPRDKVTEYAQKGFDYELKMHQLKQERQSYEDLKSEFETSKESFDKDREYWNNVDEYMKNNPKFAEVVQQEFSRVQGQQVNAPESPEVAALRQTVNQLQERLNAQDTTTQEKSQKLAEENFVKSTMDYKKVNEDFDWETKDEFGQTLQEQIEKHAVENEFKNFKDAANTFLFDKIQKRTELRAKEEAAKELLKQRKLGLGPVTSHSSKTTAQARAVSQMSYEDLASEAMTELGLD